MLGEGRRYAEIGAALGRSTLAVKTHVQVLRREGRLAPCARSWRATDTDRLVTWWAEGRSVSEIAAALGRSPGSVGHRAKVLRQAGEPIARRGRGAAGVDWDDGLFERMWRSRTISGAEIARYYGVSRRAIDLAAAARGWPPRTRSRADVYATRTKVDHAHLAALWRAGVSVREIARLCGCSPRTVMGLRAHLDLPRRTRAVGKGGHGGWGTVPAAKAAEALYAARLQEIARAA